MVNQYPWKENTTTNAASQGDPRYETPGGAQAKADQAEQDAKDYTDAKLNLPELPILNGSIVERHIRDENVSTRTLAQKAVTLPKVDNAVLDASNHSYSGSINASTVSGALNKVEDDLQYFIQNSGDSVAEIVQARVPASGIPFDTLKKRLDDSDAQLAEKIPLAQKGGPSGVASLDSASRILVNQLPDVVVKATVTGITLYVDNVSGSDANNGTSTSTPLKTRAAALAKIHPVLNADVTIIMMTGEGGTLTIPGFSGFGKLTIKGQTTTAVNYAINAVIINHCSCSINIENMAIFNSGGPNIDISGCTDVYIGNVRIPQANTGAGVQATASNLTIVSSEISNQTFGIVSNRSFIYSYNNTGSGNTLALVADQAGVIGKGGTQPSGTTNELHQNGGVIR